MRFFLRVAFILCFLSSLPLWAQDEQVILKMKDGSLEGTLSLPDHAINIPVVLLIAGSGPTDRNGNQPEAENNSLKLIAEALRKEGVACLRYDKRGVGQ